MTTSLTEGETGPIVGVNLDHLHEQVSKSLERLHHLVVEERVRLCAAEVKVITDMYSSFQDGTPGSHYGDTAGP
jgi:hypothetical protein